MGIKIALAGNPNCGKTTMFNALTGANQYVGNWPGVTVEKKEGKLKGKRKNDDIVVTPKPDLILGVLEPKDGKWIVLFGKLAFA